VLEAAYFRIGSALSTYPDRPITVILYTQQQFRDITRAPQWAAAAFDGRIRIALRGALDRPEELERVLSHELAHAVIHSIAPRGIPPWLGEGLAVLFEPRGIVWAEQELAQKKRRLPFERLTRSFHQLSGEDARLAYAQSALAARTLHDEGGGHALVAILQDLAAGRSLRTAIESRLFLSYEPFAAALGQGQ
jgi:hypothetical protein